MLKNSNGWLQYSYIFFLKQILRKVISDRRSEFPILSNWNEEAWKKKKKSGLQRDSNPWPPRYRCDALPTELWSHTLGARSIVSSYFPVKGVKWRIVYEMIHIRTADVYEGDKWSSQWISNFKQLEWRSLKKNQGFNGIRTRDLRDTGAMLYQLSYEATHWERGQLWVLIFPWKEWNDV